MSEPDPRSLLELVTGLARDIPDLLQKEVRLARSEVARALGLLLVAIGRLAIGSVVAIGAIGVALAAHAPVGIDVEYLRGEHAPADGLSFAQWTRAEATAKASGAGLTGPAGEVVIDPHLVHDLHPRTGYAAALAVLSDSPVQIVERDAVELFELRRSA